MRLLPTWQTVLFLAIWVSLTVIYGFRLWRPQPTRVVPTPGTIFRHLTTEDDPQAEPPAVMAEAALMLCHRDPRGLTGRITRSQELLTELRVPIPAG
jgi:hypothetical protein